MRCVLKLFFLIWKCSQAEKNIIYEGSNMFLGGADVGCYQTGGEVFRRFVGFDGGVSGRGGGF